MPIGYFIDITPAAGAPGDLISISAGSTIGPGQWSFSTVDWGDGTINTSSTHTYASVGTYTITADGVTTGMVPMSAMGDITISVPLAPGVTSFSSAAGGGSAYSGVVSAGSIPFTAVFTSTSTPTPSTYVWKIDGVTVSTSSSFSHTFTTVGTPSVTLDVTWAPGDVSGSTSGSTETVVTATTPNSTAYRPIYQYFETNNFDAGDPSMVKHWADCSFVFRATNFDTMLAGFLSDFSTETRTVTLTAPAGSGGWGTFAWGTLPWGVSTAVRARLRTSVPKMAMRSNWLSISGTLNEAFTDLQLAGLALTFSAMSSRQKSSSRQ